MQDLKFFNAFNSIPGVGLATLRALKMHFGTFEVAWRADEELLQSGGVTYQPLQAILWKRSSVSPDREMEKLIREGVWLMDENDPCYPAVLKEIPQPPLALYGRGKTECLTNIAVGLVGTRRPTAYGLEVTEKIAHDLAIAGITVVSGLALGVDGRAHEATIEARGTTIAVLGSGVDQYSIFPPEHRGLARRITESMGTVISEYAPGTPATKDHFPQRNRLISGLSRGVVVVEAREKSGALITARLALEQNREVFAIPGSIFTATAQGPHRLIQEGAKLVTSAEDVLKEIGVEYTGEREQKVLDGFLGEYEQALLELLQEPLTVDVIREKTKIKTAAIVATLSMLELKGAVKNLGGDTYQKVS